MEVLRIRLNSNRFQSFLPVDQRVWAGDQLRLDGTRKLDRWETLEVYIHNSSLQKGNFSHFCSGGFVVDMKTVEKLCGFFDMAGELLPISCSGSTYYLVNILDCVNCLDDEMSTWVLGRTSGSRIRIKEYAFDNLRFSESTVFKIPETAASEVLASSGIKDPADEFRFTVETHGLTGILFESLWKS